MDFQPPICCYCQKMYSKFNEQIFIVCLCDEIAKYAHGSCFREHLKSHNYGVCGSCLTKTRIVPDGYKPLGQWKIPNLRPLYGFWTRLLVENRYWKIVYCRETKGRKRNRTIRRYSDVPDQLPWQQETEALKGQEEEIGFEVVKDGRLSHTKNGEFNETADDGFKIPTVFVPRGYPYVKKQIDYEDDEQSNGGKYSFDDQFEYYPTLDNLSISYQAWHRSSMNSSSVYSVSVAEDQSQEHNDVSNSNVSNEVTFKRNDSNDNTAPMTPETTKNNSDKKSSKLKNLFRNKKNDSGNSRSDNHKKKPNKQRKPSNNNNPHQQKYHPDDSRIVTMELDENDRSNGGIAVIPLKSDIIFMPVTQEASNDENHHLQNGIYNLHPESNEKMSKNKNKKNKNKKDKKGKKELNDLYGVSTSMFKPVIQRTNTPEPESTSGGLSSHYSSSYGDRSFTQLKVENLPV